jgi:uncharacterized protein with von Willebrand factor type A (vWA) domain
VLDVLDGFVAELRAAGMTISVQESIDAAEAVTTVGLARRDALASALSATLVKSAEHRPLFQATFDVFFSQREIPRSAPGTSEDPNGDPGAAPSVAAPGTEGAPADALVDPAELRRMAVDALRSGEGRALRSVARLAVELFGGVDPFRPVGVAYYLHRTVRALDLESLLEELVAEPDGEGALLDALGDLGRRLRAEEATERSEELQALVEAEIRRRLVEARGAAQVAKTLRRPLVDDVDFISATREELAALRRTIRPLARVLATRLARRRRRGRRGTLDFRRTIRRSLSTGGVPLEPRFRPPHPAQPEIVVLADISGSVASFARFTLHLVYAISGQFAKVRTVVFIDDIEDVTETLRRTPGIADAVESVAMSSAVVGGDGHSDYGSAFLAFSARAGEMVGPRTNLIVLGDARNNYHRAETWVLADLARRAHRVYWLNPEPRAYWGSGDSIIDQYAPYCDGVFECRNLRQLRAFVDVLA